MHAFVCVIFLVGPLFCDVDGCGCCFIFYTLCCGRSLWESSGIGHTLYVLINLDHKDGSQYVIFYVLSI